MVEPTTDKGEISVESKERMVCYGRGEGRSMEDDSGWSEPRLAPLDVESKAFAANNRIIDYGHKYLSQVCPTRTIVTVFNVKFGVEINRLLNPLVRMLFRPVCCWYP